MKRELNPGVIAVVVICVLIVAGYFIWHANIDVPAYPGANAKGPSSEKMTSDEASKAGYSGATPGSKPPPDMGKH
jgi:hypothetical protein